MLPDNGNRESQNPRPRLLVSVRNAAEARAALEGGCEILDIKEPARGSLGMAEETQIQAILETARSFHAGAPHDAVPVSAALGDAVDWLDDRHVPSLPPGLTYIKLGTAGLGARCDWPDRWRTALAALQAHSTCSGIRENSGCRPHIIRNSHEFRYVTGPPGSPGRLNASAIIVAYADWRLAEAPSPPDILAAAADLGCCGVLIDTFRKQECGLFDWLSVAELATLAAAARQARLLLGLAGSLKIGDLPRLIEVAPQIVGIRSAACRGGARNAAIEAAAVRRFREALQNVA